MSLKDIEDRWNTETPVSHAGKDIAKLVGWVREAEAILKITLRDKIESMQICEAPGDLEFRIRISDLLAEIEGDEA